MARQDVELNPLAVSIEKAGKLLGLSRNLAYDLAKSGEIPTVPCGKKRRVVPVEALKEMLRKGMQQSNKSAFEGN